MSRVIRISVGPGASPCTAQERTEKRKTVRVAARNTT